MVRVMTSFTNVFLQVRVRVERTHHNANHLDLGSDQVEIASTTRFHEPEVAARRSEIQRLRHANDPEFHEASLKILKRSREARFWSEERILEAIRDFHAKTGRAPSYYDFRKTKELPDYATLWKRFGALGVAISSAFDHPAKSNPRDPPEPRTNS